MDAETYIEITSLLARLNGFVARGQLKGLAFVATTCDGNIVTGSSGTYSVNPLDALAPVSMLQAKLIEAADERRARRRGDRPTLRTV